MSGFKFNFPCTATVSGATGSGKSSFIAKVIHNADKMFTTTPRRIVYFYGVWTKDFNKLKNKVEFFQGLPQEDFFYNNTLPTLAIVDDLTTEHSNNKSIIKNMFTRGSHHLNVSVFFLTQNIFDKSLRDISLNSHYIVLLKTARDQKQVCYLAQQVFAIDWRYCLDAYKQCTALPFSYMLLDLHPTTLDHLRIRSQIFPGEEQNAFIPSSLYKQPVDLDASVNNDSICNSNNKTIKMSSSLERNLPFIRKLKKMNTSNRKKFLKTCSGGIIDCFSELSKNLLKGRVSMTPGQMKHIHRHRRVLRELAKKSNSQAKRRTLLVQSGGFLSALIGPAIGLLTSLFAGRQ